MVLKNYLEVSETTHRLSAISSDTFFKFSNWEQTDDSLWNYTKLHTDWIASAFLTERIINIRNKIGKQVSALSVNSFHARLQKYTKTSHYKDLAWASAPQRPIPVSYRSVTGQLYATWQERACSPCRGDVHSSSEVDSSTAVDIANTGTLHSYDHQVWQLGSLSVLLPCLFTSVLPLSQVVSCSRSEINNTSCLYTQNGY